MFYSSDIPKPQAFINLSASKRGFSSAYILLNSRAIFSRSLSLIPVVRIKLAVLSKCFLVNMFYLCITNECVYIKVCLSQHPLAPLCGADGVLRQTFIYNLPPVVIELGSRP